MLDKKASAVVNGSGSAEFQPEDLNHGLKVHYVTGDFEKLKVTSQLPRGRFGGNEVLSLIKCEQSNGNIGIAILIQRPNNPSLLIEDWKEPVLSEDWKVVGGKLIDLNWCLATYQCNCINSLLQAHFRNFGPDDLSWEKTDENGQGLRIFKSERHR
ncbi:MAG: hypothetical protein WD335_00680 [Candidatus Paceibacterota bacterium]